MKQSMIITIYTGENNNLKYDHGSLEMLDLYESLITKLYKIHIKGVKLINVPVSASSY